MEVQNHNWILRFKVYSHSNGPSVPKGALVEQRVLGAIFDSLIVVG